MATFNYGGTFKLNLDEQLDAALQRTGDAAAAARLFMRWSEQNSEIRDLIPNLIEGYLTKRIQKRSKEKSKK